MFRNTQRTIRDTQHVIRNARYSTNVVHLLFSRAPVRVANRKCGPMSANRSDFARFSQFCGSEMSKMDDRRKNLVILNHLETHFLCKKKSRVVRSQFWKICWPSVAKKLFFMRIFEIIGYRCFYRAGESVLWALDFFLHRKLYEVHQVFRDFPLLLPISRSRCHKSLD